MTTYIGIRPPGHFHGLPVHTPAASPPPPASDTRAGGQEWD